MKDYIDKLTLKLQSGLVFGPNNSTVAVLDRRGPSEWVLKTHLCGRYGKRIRWGNTKEIRQDIEHFETYGKLPEKQVGGF